MRKHAVLFSLAVLEFAGLMLCAFFQFVMRPDLLLSYGRRAMPPATAVALSAWFLPVTALSGALLVLAAFFPVWRTKTRTYLAGAGFVCTVFGLAFAIWAAYAPVFEQLGP